MTWTDEKEGYVIGKHNREYYGISLLTDDIRTSCLKTVMAHSHLECYWNEGALLKKKYVRNKPYLTDKTPLNWWFLKKRLY